MTLLLAAMLPASAQGLLSEGFSVEALLGSYNDQLYFRAKVTNSSRTHTIRAFELYMYATDVWGDKVYDATTYYGTTMKTLKPGQTAFSDYFLLPNRSRISKVWCGVKKVIFKDGTIRENDAVDYANWTIK